MNRRPPQQAVRVADLADRKVAGVGGGRGGFAARNGGQGDLSQMLERSPVATFADLKPGDAIVVLSTEGATQGKITAITLLAGVEPILTRPGTREMSLGGWSLSAGGGGITPAQQ